VAPAAGGLDSKECATGYEEKFGSELEEGSDLRSKTKTEEKMNRRYKQLAARGIEPRLYNVWVDMRQHCNNPNNQVYSYYGGRGIRVCKRWDKFENFVTDVGPHPGKGWTLDRKNNNGHYRPSNIRWATRSTQQRNKRTTKLTVADVIAIRARYRYRENQYTPGMGYQQLADEYGVGRTTIENIVKRVKWKNIS